MAFAFRHSFTRPPVRYRQKNQSGHKDKRLQHQDSIWTVTKPGQIEQETRDREIEDRNRWNEAQERYQPREIPRKMGSKKNHEYRSDDQAVSQVTRIIALILHQPHRKNA